MNTRSWPIRSKIMALVIVPLAALMALWIFATTLTLGPALNLLATKNLLDNVGVPGEALVRELKYERRLSLIYLAGGDDTDLREQRKRTDEAIADFRRRVRTERVRDDANDVLTARIEQTLTVLDILPTARDSISRRQMDRPAALGLYSNIIASAFRTFFVLTALPDEDITRRAQALTALGQSREVLSQADALLAGVFTAGRFEPGEHAQFVQLIGTKRFLTDTALADLPDTARTAYGRMAESEAFVRLEQLADAIADGDGRRSPGVDPEAWRSAHEAVQQQMRDFELRASDELAEESVPVAVRILLRLAFAGVLGLIAVIASLVVAVRVGRTLVLRLTGLRTAALELAKDRLPSVVERLRRGEEVDGAAETPDLSYGYDEIGQVAMAFREVHRTAVQSAIDEATLRRGFNEVFLNIARRSQAMLHRQLAILDRMERRTTDPEELEDLFRLDHLATRMRRNAEDLVILAGAHPGRTWRDPIPMIDVLRGALSEVEDYVRVDISVVQSAATVGRAVADVIHLVAELIENATLFSPPQTRVRVTGQLVPKGYVIEIEDRGLGMTAEAMEEANLRLASPPEFDPANSARLGLFVVARLAARHGIHVRLRPSPYGGITAVVLLPSELVVPGEERTAALATRPALPAAGGGSTAASAPSGGVVVAMPVKPDTNGPKNVSDATTSGAEDADRTMELPATVLRPTGAAQTRIPGQPSGGESENGRSAQPNDGDSAGTSDAPSDGKSPGRPIELSRDGLPRRVRQNRTRRPGPTSARATGGESAAARSPEQIRAAMSALQAGTMRGRRDAAAIPAAATPHVDVPDARPGDVTESGRNE